MSSCNFLKIDENVVILRKLSEWIGILFLNYDKALEFEYYYKSTCTFYAWINERLV